SYMATALELMATALEPMTTALEPMATALVTSSSAIVSLQRHCVSALVYHAPGQRCCSVPFTSLSFVVWVVVTAVIADVDGQPTVV
ncbi:hypothetical protein, partial [Bosea sp. (in: a-proteobacteria)]|uniref:hypothetical protein n=1 Tax=Bosea sp. (in: a-proteobacteria) TaxID=1871050 RepID=UPI0040339DA2